MATFAIDYDGTWTLDPAAFTQIAAVLRAAGHTVIMVTQRCNTPKVGKPVRAAAAYAVADIVWAAGQPKRVAALRDGYLVDVWIDDNPHAVFTALKHRDCP